MSFTGGAGAGGGGGGIGFITETEIEEKRKARQEEWDRVRKPDEPIEAPVEEAYDGRSLFDRLQEQKNIKQEEFDESRKLKNLVKVLDDDECEFLDYVDQAKIDEEKRKRNEEAKELSEFRSAVSKLREKDLEMAISKEIALGVVGVVGHDGTSSAGVTRTKKLSESDSLPPSIGIKRVSQSQLLAGLVKRRSISSSTSTPGGDDGAGAGQGATAASGIGAGASTKVIKNIPPAGIPGLASYGSSSGSESDENSTEDPKKA